MNIKLLKNLRGDTIIEVMISIALAGMVIAGSFAMAGNSLRQGVTASERTEALKHAESQVESLKFRLQRSSSPIWNSHFAAADEYCLRTNADSENDLPNWIPIINSNPNVIPGGYHAGCMRPSAADAKYFINISIPPVGGPGVPQNPTYLVTVKWNGANNVENQAQVYYRLAERIGAGGQPLPVVNLTANPATINSGQSSSLTWTTTNATSCEGVGGPPGWAGPKVLNVGPPGLPTGPLTTTTTYILRCTGPGSPPPVDDPATVNVLAGFNWQANGSPWASCSPAEPAWNDGFDGCFTTGTSMFARRNITIRYNLSGVRAGPATIEIRYREYAGDGSQVPPGYTNYSVNIATTGTPQVTRLLPTAPIGVQQIYTGTLNINQDLPAQLSITWTNNSGNDPDLQIDSIRIFR